MRTVFLAGGIGSGKSTVARELERLGAARIDLDQLSRDVLSEDADVISRVAEAFGDDLIDPETGLLDRSLLARRAFATRDAAALLEQIELPAISALLERRLAALGEGEGAPRLCVVEVPLLDRVDPEMLAMADGVLVVSCPVDVRRERAIGRGMTGEDFDARAANQPTDEWLRAHATDLIDNSGGSEELLASTRRWYDRQLVR